MGKIYLSQLNNNYILIKSNDHDLVLKLLMKLILTNDNYSIVSSENEISIMINSDNIELKELMKYSNIHDYLCTESIVYKCVSVTTDESMLSETGLLADVTSMFSSNNISILLLSTYSSNLIFYQKEYEQQLIDVVEKNNNYVLTDD